MERKSPFPNLYISPCSCKTNKRVEMVPKIENQTPTSSLLPVRVTLHNPNTFSVAHKFQHAWYLARCLLIEARIDTIYQERSIISTNSEGSNVKRSCPSFSPAEFSTNKVGKPRTLYRSIKAFPSSDSYSIREKTY